MADINSLLQRIDAEFAAGRQKIRDFQAEQLEAYEGRERRLALFEQTCEKLREVWRPRLEALAQKFGEQVNVTPQIHRDRREATFEFESNLAQIVLRFTVSTDQEVRKLVLDYRLEILPILMKFEPHKQAEFPLEAVDVDAVGRWFDDRLVDFVRTYLSLHQNEYYLKDHMVSDPIAGVRFPKFAAASTLEWQGQKYYFIGEKTRSEFQKKHGIA
ncbi:MAG TPA: hypothetical protein VL475_10810 [Planctomycetaceae bacterium]|nr:hypothetical protein [Planctomycetaceae bacterium]